MKKIYFLILNIFLSLYLFSANITVDDMQIIADTHFDTADNKLKNNTYFKLKTSFEGGYKFSATIGFETNTTELEKQYLTGTAGIGAVYLLFHDASVTARNLFDSHLDMSLWTGTFRYLGAGNYYKGNLFYPETILDDIQGFYRLRGTGISATAKFWEEKIRFRFHLYENTNFIQPTDTFTNLNYFTFDNEIGLYLDFLYLELFYGYTKDIVYPNEKSTLYAGRGKVGFTFWVGNKDIEFFSTIGVPDIENELISSVSSGQRNLFDSLFLLAELKFTLYKTNNTITFITVPSLYNETATNKKSDFDINYKLLVSSPDKSFNGGTNFNFTYDINSDGSYDWHLMLAPYFSIVLSGVEWFASTGFDFASLQKMSETGNKLEALGGLKFIVGVTSSF